MIPSEEEALALHRKHGSKEIVVRHCRVVAGAAAAVADAFRAAGTPVDSSIVRAGALLHDIGRSRVMDVTHGFVGSEMLEADGVDERVVQAVRKHVGAGLSPDEARGLGLPDRDYIPRTLEERIVCFADKMVSTERVRPFSEEVDRFVRKGHDVARLLALKEGLARELGRDPEALLLDNVKESG